MLLKSLNINCKNLQLTKHGQVNHVFDLCVMLFEIKIVFEHKNKKDNFNITLKYNNSVENHRNFHTSKKCQYKENSFLEAN